MSIYGHFSASYVTAGKCLRENPPPTCCLVSFLSNKHTGGDQISVGGWKTPNMNHFPPKHNLSGFLNIFTQRGNLQTESAYLSRPFCEIPQKQLKYMKIHNMFRKTKYYTVLVTVMAQSIIHTFCTFNIDPLHGDVH